MSTVTTILIAVGALFLALLLAFVPLRLMMYAIGKGVTTAVKEFIERRRERRSTSREGTDRRKAP